MDIQKGFSDFITQNRLMAAGAVLAVAAFAGCSSSGDVQPSRITVPDSIPTPSIPSADTPLPPAGGNQLPTGNTPNTVYSPGVSIPSSDVTLYDPNAPSSTYPVPTGEDYPVGGSDYPVSTRPQDSYTDPLGDPDDDGDINIYDPENGNSGIDRGNDGDIFNNGSDYDDTEY